MPASLAAAPRLANAVHGVVVGQRRRDRRPRPRRHHLCGGSSPSETIRSIALKESIIPRAARSVACGSLRQADYAVRAAVELAGAGEDPVKGERLADAQGIPLQFLEHILLELKHARLVRARRGARGGYWLARPPEEITLANVIRAVEGPLANIQDMAPEATDYPGTAKDLTDVWIAVRASLRRVLERVTIADLRDGAIPAEVLELTRDDGAWVTR
jgi:Rrf2 family protein